MESFPALDACRKISIGGGSDPVWSPTGEELFFRSGRALVSVAVQLHPQFTAGRPETLFETDLSGRRSAGMARYDVTADGQHFVRVRDSDLAGGAGIDVVLGLTGELLRLSARGGR